MKAADGSQVHAWASSNRPGSSSTNLYAYTPGSSSSVAVQAPSWSAIGVASVSQSLKVPATATASGAFGELQVSVTAQSPPETPGSPPPSTTSSVVATL